MARSLRPLEQAVKPVRLRARSFGYPAWKRRRVNVAGEPPPDRSSF